MSEYKGIKGFQVQTRTEDPTPYAQALADNPYAGAWGSGGALNTGRESVASSGTLTSGQAAAGYASPGVTNAVENYNGTSWTEVAEVNTTRRQAKGAGTANTATIIFGGTTTGGVAPSATTETWNGSAWTEVNDLNTGRSSGVSSQYGSTTAALLATGRGSPGSPPSDSTGFTNVVESWNGSSWTEVTETGTSRRLALGSGTSTSMLVASGQISPNNTANVESWNGSAWTEIAEVNTSRNSGGSAGVSNSSNLIFGGYSGGAVAVTEDWNGSAWTEVNDLSTAEYDHDGAGTSSAAWSAGGNGYESRTEEWSFSGLDPSTTPAASYADAITGDFYYNSTTGQFKAVNAGVGSWSSGGDMNTARYHSGGAGNSNSAVLAYLGYTNPSNTYTVNNEDYNGTAWTEVANLNVGAIYAGGTGSNTAAIECGGNTDNPSNYSATTEVWNGTSWTEVNDLNKGRNGVALFGTSTAAIGASGYQTSPDSYSTAVESWDGTSWTEIAEVNYGKYGASAAGTVATAGIVMGGENPGMPAEQKNTESWNGSAWTEVGDMNQGRSWTWSGGSSTDAVAAAGQPPSVNTETWDGTSWTEVNNLATARGYAYGKCGTSGSNSIYAGGVTSPPGLSGKLATTEEWTLPDFEIKTVTTS